MAVSEGGEPPLAAFQYTRGKHMGRGAVPDPGALGLSVGGLQIESERCANNPYQKGDHHEPGAQ